MSKPRHRLELQLTRLNLPVHFLDKRICSCVAARPYQLLALSEQSVQLRLGSF